MPRKSAMDLFKACLVPETVNAPMSHKDAPTEYLKQWHYEHKCRAQIQRNGITRTRPAIKVGWRAEFIFSCLTPEYVSEELFHEVLEMTGRLIGTADFRPTYGRFMVTEFERLE